MTRDDFIARIVQWTFGSFLIFMVVAWWAFVATVLVKLIKGAT